MMQECIPILFKLSSRSSKKFFIAPSIPYGGGGGPSQIVLVLGLREILPPILIQIPIPVVPAIMIGIACKSGELFDITSRRMQIHNFPAHALMPQIFGQQAETCYRLPKESLQGPSDQPLFGHFEPKSKLLVSLLIFPKVVSYIIPHITPFKEFRL